MLKTKRYFFYPFLDHLTAVAVMLLIVLAFGNFLSNPLFSALATILSLFTLCGRIYVRMWKLSRKNTRYGYGLTFKDFIHFIIPLVVFDLVLAVFYCLYENGIIPLDKMIVSHYYIFPDNAPRELITISFFEYIAVGVKVWFSHMIYILKNGFILFLSPILSFIFGVLGYKLGDKNKLLTDMVEEFVDKIKKKFSE